MILAPAFFSHFLEQLFQLDPQETEKKCSLVEESQVPSAGAETVLTGRLGILQWAELVFSLHLPNVEIPGIGRIMTRQETQRDSLATIEDIEHELLEFDPIGTCGFHERPIRRHVGDLFGRAVVRQVERGVAEAGTWHTYKSAGYSEQPRLPHYITLQDVN